jgi:predicted nucleotidyltransferase
MAGTLLNVSGKISSFEVEIFDIIHRAVSQWGIPYIVVGASARDLVLHHAHGVEIIRATGDIDFGVQVESWDAFLALKTTLLEKHFKESDQKQRLISPLGIPVDFVPFGAIEDDNATISWPPEKDVEMHVLGFREACEHADIVRVRDHPALDIPVVTMAGLSIQKIIAWTNRAPDIRRKDAIDLLYLLKNHERIPSVNEESYEISGLLEQYGWDATLAGAHLLGTNSAEIILPDTAHHISRLETGDMAPLGIERLVEEMSSDDNQFERNFALLEAYLAGLNKDPFT